MFAKLAGHTPLADMISQIIDDSRSKIAAAEGGEDEKKDDKKPNPFFAKKDDKKPAEKKDEEKSEKKASAELDLLDAEGIDKLASALDQVGEEFIKSADKQEKGGESPVGGTSLPVMSPVAGKQPYKKDGSKHETPKSTGLQAGDAGNVAKTQVPNDANLKAIANYPKKGVMKTAAEAVMAKMKAEAEGVAEADAEEGEGEETAPAIASEAKPEVTAEKPKAASVQKLEKALDQMSGTELAEKVAAPAETEEEPVVTEITAEDGSPVDFILNKMAASGNVEKRMGGMTLDSKSGDGPKPPSGAGREMISSNTAPVSATKAKAKAPQKKLMSQVLTEPMQSKSNDSKVSENLRNASKGGVKIAAARELLKKVAAEGCQCDGKGECKYCKMKKSMSSSPKA